MLPLLTSSHENVMKKLKRPFDNARFTNDDLTKLHYHFLTFVLRDSDLFENTLIMSHSNFERFGAFDRASNSYGTSGGA